MATIVLLRLAAWTGEGRYREAAEGALGQLTPYLHRYPGAFAHWLAAADLLIAGIDELAIVGDPGDAGTRSLLALASRGYRPHQVLAVSAEPESSRVPLLHGRAAIDGWLVHEVAGDAGKVVPSFDPGDALLFDDHLVHRTHVTEDMVDPRLALECWFFAPSHPNDEYVPLLV